jgi:hypothetical protein
MQKSKVNTLTVYVAGAHLYEHTTHKQRLHPQQPLRVAVAGELRLLTSEPNCHWHIALMPLCQ